MITAGGAFERASANLSDLGLDEMAALLPGYMRMVAEGERDFCGALCEMTAAEAAAKRAKSLDRRMRNAGFPFVKSLADFDFDFQPSVPRAIVEELATLRFVEQAENVILVGSSGVGKTHIAIALGGGAVKAGKEVRFVDCARLIADLKQSADHGTLQRRLRYYAHSSLLVIDEVGYLAIDGKGAELLFQVVSARYERRSTIVTTNVPLGGWAAVLGDPVKANAITDRLCHHCTHIKVTGRSYRMKDLPLSETARKTAGEEGADIG